MNIYIKMVKNKNKKPPARINFEKKKDDKLRFFFKLPYPKSVRDLCQ